MGLLKPMSNSSGTVHTCLISGLDGTVIYTDKHNFLMYDVSNKPFKNTDYGVRSPNAFGVNNRLVFCLYVPYEEKKILEKIIYIRCVSSSKYGRFNINFDNHPDFNVTYPVINNVKYASMTVQGNIIWTQANEDIYLSYIYVYTSD